MRSQDRRSRGPQPFAEVTSILGDSFRQQIQDVINGNPKRLIEVAEKLGQTLAQGGERDKLSPSQIRNIFGTVKRIEMDELKNTMMKELILLKPKLAYQAARHNNKGVRVLRDVLSISIDCIDENIEHFKNFVSFFEAILAYHKASEIGG